MPFGIPTPQGLALKAGAALLALTIAFGGGYYVAVNQAERNASSAIATAVKAQELLDVERHNGAVAESTIATERRVRADQKIKTIIQRIPQTVFVAGTCDVNEDTIKLLNEAGHAADHQ